MKIKKNKIKTFRCILHEMNRRRCPNRYRQMRPNSLRYPFLLRAFPVIPVGDLKRNVFIFKCFREYTLRKIKEYQFLFGRILLGRMPFGPLAE